MERVENDEGLATHHGGAEGDDVEDGTVVGEEVEEGVFQLCGGGGC